MDGSYRARARARNGRNAGRGKAVARRGGPGAGRRAMVHATILVVVAGSLFAPGLGVEWWPFSRYTMYARRQPRTTATIWLLGERQDGARTWLPDPDRVLAPMDRQRLEGVLSRLPPGSEARRQVARWIRARYRVWEAGQSGILPLREVWIYRARWTLVPGAANIAHPDMLQLLGASTRP